MATIEKVSNTEQSIEVESLTLLDILQGEVPVLAYCNAAEGAEYQFAPQMLKNNILPAMLVIMMHPDMAIHWR